MRRLCLLFAVTAILTILFAGGIVHVNAQQITPTQTPNPSANNADIEQRVFRLETIIASYQTLITIFGILISIVVSILIILQAITSRREGKRESREAKREENRDKLESAGARQFTSLMNVVQQTLSDREARQARNDDAYTMASTKGVDDVSKVMDLVQKTLQSRLDAETKSALVIQRLEEKIKKITDTEEKRILTINKSRESIEKTAKELAQISRQGFKAKNEELNSFSQKFDEFQRNYEELAETKFSQRVLYIRGIAAHFNNKPKDAIDYLTKATTSNQATIEGESELDRDKRIANSFYYLGLIESNFGKYEDAIKYFDRAKPETQKDFLTMIVTAEAYLMNNQPPKAIQLISTIKTLWQQDAQNNDRRLLSRAILMEASIPIMEQGKGWEKTAQELLEPVHRDDPLYYYATATLAQIYLTENNVKSASALFNEAYEKLERSGDLSKGSEVRVKIHLLMVAGMCCLNGPTDMDRAKEYLNNARSILSSLPTIDGVTCTVFSNLTKLNVKSEDIKNHIELIKKGKVFILSDIPK